jgi:hypothetical protein
LIRTERVEGAHPISTAAARSDPPATILLRAAATCSSLNCFSNKPMMQVFEQQPRSTHWDAAFNDERRDVRLHAPPAFDDDPAEDA